MEVRKILVAVLILIFAGCTATGKRSGSENGNQSKIMGFYKEWKGTNYKLGGNGKKGIDCSALVQKLYKEEFKKNIPRTTATQVKEGKKVSRKNLKAGDLIFFKIKRNVRHVGVYVGNNKFMHASTSRGVMISEFNNYWNKKYWQSRRLL